MPVYLQILIFLLVSLSASIFLLVLGGLLAPNKPNSAKKATYECGFPAIGEARMPFDVRFYLVAILFIIFDIETAFLFPWAVCFRKLGSEGFIAMAIFLGVLVVGFVYEWSKGALEWE
ncbi:MAG: NADH-quinone oxidoreductase subunit A [Pseudomonadota bacterium]|nr:NADH-quinone oxidoreductase subunit A [Pseudomonadota bacterium]